MKPIITIIAISALLCSALTIAKASALYKKAAENKIYAQSLVSKIMTKNADLLVIGVHAKAPGCKAQTMIATNLDRVGKADDADDLLVTADEKTIISANKKDPNKVEVQLPLHDQSGHTIGALGLVFRGTMSQEVAFHSSAVAIRDDMASNIKDLAALFTKR